MLFLFNHEIVVIRVCISCVTAFNIFLLLMRCVFFCIKLHFTIYSKSKINCERNKAVRSHQLSCTKFPDLHCDHCLIAGIHITWALFPSQSFLFCYVFYRMNLTRHQKREHHLHHHFLWFLLGIRCFWWKTTRMSSWKCWIMMAWPGLWFV